MIPTRALTVPVAALCLFAAPVPGAAGSLAGYGLRTGIAASSISGDYENGIVSDTRVGFSGALYCRVNVTHLLSIQPEIGFTSKGDQGDLPTHSGFERRIDYLEIPVLLRVGAANSSAFEPFLLVGPQLAFPTGSDLEIDASTSASAATAASAWVRWASIFENVGTFDNPSYRNVDFSAIAGGGLALGRAPFRVIVDARYVYGLTGTFANADASFAHNGSWITTIGFELR